MALTFTSVTKPYADADKFESVYTIACDNSYPTGGYSMKPTDLGFASTVDPDWLIRADNKAGLYFEYDYTNQKILVKAPVRVFTATFDPASLAAITSRDDAVTVTGVLATDECIRCEPPAAILSSVVVQGARVTGADTVTVRLTNPSAGAVDVLTGTWKFYIAGALGVTKEVANATDLSAVTGVRVVARGKFRG